MVNLASMDGPVTHLAYQQSIITGCGYERILYRYGARKSSARDLAIS